MRNNYIRFDEAINKTLHSEMLKNKKTVYFGLGADDSSRVFNTTTGLREKYGNLRVFDTPISENSIDRCSSWYVFKWFFYNNVSSKNGFFFIGNGSISKFSCKMEFYVW